MFQCAAGSTGFRKEKARGELPAFGRFFSDSLSYGGLARACRTVKPKNACLSGLIIYPASDLF
jgi:hypothetical protein